MISGRLTAEEIKPAVRQTKATPASASASGPLLTHFRGNVPAGKRKRARRSQGVMQERPE
jgi:hypothetical protein